MNAHKDLAASAYDYKRYKILFVDDEPQARDFFAEVFADDFDVLTAEDAEAAWQIMEQQGEQIGVIITDQRMPGQQGVDLLSRVKIHCPAVVRILTTAYADQSNAIDAVNSGGVFSYVTKPWDLDHVQGVLMRALEFFLIRQERDQLLREKLHVLHRLIVMDRVRGLAALAVSLRGRLRHAPSALKAYLAQAPIGSRPAILAHDAAYLDLRTLARTEAEGLICAIEKTLQACSPSGQAETEDCPKPEEERLDLPSLIADILDHPTENARMPTVRLHVDSQSAGPAIRGDARLFRHLCVLLLERLGRLSGGGAEIQVRLQGPSEERAEAGVSLHFGTTRSDFSGTQLAPFFAAAVPSSGLKNGIEGDLLPAFFLAYHYGGCLRVDTSGNGGLGLTLEFWTDTDRSLDDRLDAQWFDQIFSQIEESQ